MDVTVCVATFRRPAGLARLLASLGRMKLPEGTRVEVVVVDNDPDAQEPSRPLAAGSLPVRRLREPRRNIAYARNAAVGAARGRWLAFVDDDEEVHEGWLAAFIAQSERTPCDGLFGPLQARAEQPESASPAALAYFVRESGLESGARVSLSAARTGNAFLSRRLFDAILFDADFGLTGGEDTRLFEELLKRGADLRWCQAARVDEWLPPERLRASWLLRRAFRAGCVYARILRRTQSAPIWLALPEALARCAAALALLPLAALRGAERRQRAAMRVCGTLGRIWGLLGGRYEEYRGARGELPARGALR